MSHAQELIVGFTGPGRSGPLTRGQGNILRSLLSGPHQVALDVVVRPPTPTAPEEVRDALGELLTRHESLRTTYRLGSPPSQVVAERGELRVTVHEARREDAGAVAAALKQRLWEGRFDLERELPLRAALVTSGGRVTHVVLVVSHLAADAVALRIVTGELADILAGRTLGPPGPQPLDLVAAESTSAVRRRIQASGEYWRDALLRAPHSLLPLLHPEPGGATDTGLMIWSPPAGKDLECVARRTGASRSAVLLAAVAVLLAHRSGYGSCAVTSASSNRFLPQLRSYVGTVATDAFMVLDVGGRTFDAAVAGCAAAALRAYRCGWFDTAQIYREIERIGHERGIPGYMRECVFNDMSGSGAHPSTSDVRGALARARGARRVVSHEPIADGTAGELIRLAQRDELTRLLARLTVTVYQLDDDLVCTVWADPRCLSAVDTEAFARALLRLLAAAASDNVLPERLQAVTGLEPLSRGPHWRLVDAGWVDLTQVGAMLEGVLPGYAWKLDASRDIVCYVSDPAGRLTPERLHRDCLRAVEGWPAVITPQRYVICDQAPDDPDAWWWQPVRVSGTGRTGGPDAG